MRRLLTIGIALTAIACGTFLWIYRTAEFSDSTLILGHGGMGIQSALPLDSKASIQNAVSYPIDGVEMDVKMTSDSVLVSFHDDQLAKVSNCSGSIREKTFNELSVCENRTWLNAEPVSSIKEILNSVIAEGTTISFDLKPDSENESYRNVYTQQIANLISEFAQFHFLIESNDEELLTRFDSLQTNAKLFYYCNSISEGIEACNEYGFSGMSIDMKFIEDPTEIERAQNAGFEVMLWGCGSVFSNREALKYRPNIIQTDDIGSMMRILDVSDRPDSDSP